MRKVRIFSIIVFIMAIAMFGLYKNHEKRTIDTKAPEITMDEPKIKVSCKDGNDVLLKGITAEDDKDGDVTDSLLVESVSNFLKNKKRKVTVVAFDSANNASKSSRTIQYTDYHSPKFSLDEPLRFPTNTPDILGTLGVQDVLDGDLTEKIKMSSEYYVQADVAGDYPMIFSVSNSAGDVVKLPVTIQIYDPAKEAQSPKLILSEYMIYVKPGTEINPRDYLKEVSMGNISYVKSEDGNFYDPKPLQNQARTAIMQDEIEITQDADYNTPGVYEITYQMTDNSGREERTGKVRLIVVVSK